MTLASAAPAAPLDAVVIGAGVAGLVAARELAGAGLRVEVLEAAREPGGCVRPLRLGDLTVDRGAESFATRGGHVAALADELGLERVDPAGAGSWLVFADGAAPTPKGTLMGIPADVTAADVVRALGVEGARAAARDSELPVGDCDERTTIGALVRERMGEAVLRRLVEPVVGGVYSASADAVPVRALSPDLLEALRETGSLAAAVGRVRGSAVARPGAQVQGIAGGMHRLVASLTAAVRDLGGGIRLATPVTGVHRDGDWVVTTDAGRLRARAVVIAADGETGASLLQQLQPEARVPKVQTSRVELVTLLLPAGAIDGAPRGTGALVADADHIEAKALTHATAKWSWLRAAAAGREVVRLSYGTTSGLPATAQLTDDECFEQALRDAEAILGQRLTNPLAAARVRLAQHRTRQQPDARIPYAAVVGAWCAGTGLASVVPHAIGEAQRLARALQKPE